MKRQVTVATLMVSSTVLLSSCVADIGTRSASEETTKVDEAGGISSADGAGGTTGDPGDDAEGNQGESAHTNGEKNAGGAGQPGEAGATGSGDTSGVLPPLGEFDPADPSFEIFFIRVRRFLAGIFEPSGSVNRLRIQDSNRGFPFVLLKVSKVLEELSLD